MKIEVTNFPYEVYATPCYKWWNMPARDLLCRMGVVGSGQKYLCIVTAGGFAKCGKFTGKELSLMPVTSVALIGAPRGTMLDYIKRRK